LLFSFFFFSSRRRHTRSKRDWSSDVCSSDLDVEAINAISGERCNPHPHNFTDRILRPGDQAFFDILQSYQGYRTCYYRTFNVGRSEERRVGKERRYEWELLHVMGKKNR